MTEPLAIANVCISSALAGVLWVVQLVVYPAFREIDAARFHAWHRNYTATITWIVAPLILGQITVIALLFVMRGPDAALIAEASCAALACGVTAGISVPIHEALGRDASEQLIGRLVATNWIRTIAWTTAAILAIAARA